MKKFKLLITIIAINIVLVTIISKAQTSNLHLIDFSGTNGSYPRGSLISDGTYLYGMTSAGGANSNYGTLFKVKTDGTSYMDMLDFTGSNGSTPYGSLLSDGTYLYGMTSAGGTNGSGLVFKITLGGAGYDTIMNFNGTNGSSPYGSLISDGTYLYGMTYSGGANGYGTIFKVKPDKTGYQKILDFNNTNGSYPEGSLFYDGTYLYGMTSSGGTNGYGNIFKIKPDGTGYLDLMDFSSTTGNYPYGSLVSDGTYLYGMTSSGGTGSSGIIFKIKSDGTGYASVLDFNGTNGSSPQGDLIISSGVLSGMTSNGGMNYYGNIFKIKTDGSNYTNIYNFDNTNGSYPYGALYSDGTFYYGMTNSGGGNSNGTLFKINPTCSNITLTSASGTDAQSICFNNAITKITYQCSGTTASVVGLPAGVGSSFSSNILTMTGTPTVTGSYTYTVTTKGATGCTPDSSVVVGSININTLPTATMYGTTTVCQNSATPALLFTGANGTAPYTFTYKINGGFSLTIVSANTKNSDGYSTPGDTIHLYAPTNVAGTFTYSLVSVKDASSAACSNAQSGSDTITVKPLSVMTSTNSATICSGSAVKIPLTANVSSTYTWIASNNLNTTGESTAMQSTNTLTNTITNSATTSQIVTYTVTPSNSCGTGFSQVVNVSIDPTTVAGTVSSSATICSGNNSGILSLSGQRGSVLMWQYSTNGGTSYTNIANTAASQSYLNLSATTQYRSVVKSGVCTTVNSSAAILTVNPVSVGGTVSSSATVCSGTNSGTLTLSGQTGSVVSWQSSVNGGTTYSNISNTTTSLSYSNLTTTTFYRAVVQNGVCASSYSSVSIITVNPVSVGGTISAVTTVCAGNNSGVLNLSGQTGSVLKWQSSTDGGTTYADITNTSTSQSYLNLSATTQYRAVVQSGVCNSANSAGVIITVTPVSVGGTISANATVCSGTNTGTLSLSGQTGSVVGWQSSIDGGTTYTNVANTNTSQSYSNLTTTTIYRAIVQNGVCASVNSSLATITVNANSVGGIISSASTVCSGNNSGVLSLTGQTGNVLRWQYSTNGGTTYTNNSNTAISQSYLNLITTTQYVAVVQNGVCAPASSSVTVITVNPVSIGGSISSSATVCSGANTGTLTLSGQTGSIVKWQSSIDGGTTYTNVANTSTNQSYSNLTTTTLYRAVVQSGVCASANSALGTITVNTVSMGGTVTASAMVCKGVNSGTLNLSGQTGSISKWQYSTNGGTTYSDISNTASSQLFSNITATTSYRAVIKSGVCSSANSSSVTVTVSNLPTVSVQSSNQSATGVCNGYLEATASGKAPFIYVWSDSSTVNSRYRYKVCSGNYSVTVIDSLGCTVNTQAHVGINTTSASYNNPLNVSVTSTNTSANASCDGTAVVNVTGGTPPYNINFAGNIVQNSFTSLSNLCSGFYTVNVTDAKSNSSSFTFVVGSPSTVFVSVDPRYTDSTVVDTKVTNAIPNCNISYGNIDSIKITGYSYIGHDSINATWTIYQGTGNTVINTQYAKYGNIQAPGVYVLELDLYCTNRTSGSVRATDDIYVDNRLANAITSVEADDNTVAYPNPFNNTLNIVGDKNSAVKITDVSGKELYAYTINSAGKLTIDTGSLDSGIYFIIITNNTTVITKKVIKN